MKILLIRLRLVGDVVFTTPAIRALRRAFPSAHLAYLVEREGAPVVAGNPHLDEIIVADRAGGLGRVRQDLALAHRLYRARYDVVIDFHGGPRSSWLAWATRAPRRIGYTVAGRSWIYTVRVSRSRALRPRHSVENQWDLLAPLGDEFRRRPDPLRDPVEMSVDAGAAATVSRRLRAAGIAPDTPLIVVHVSAGNRFRTWPVPSFVELVVALLSGRPERRLVLTAGPSGAAAVAEIRGALRSRLGETDGLVLDGPDVDLAELRALVDRAALFVGGDSGPLHIAATSPAPIVGLYGPTLPVRSAPWRDAQRVTASVDVGELPCRPCDQRVCEPGDFRCLTSLAPGRVIAAAENALARWHDDRVRYSSSRSGPA